MAQATTARIPARSKARAAGYLRSAQGGLFPVAVLVGVGSGLGAVAFLPEDSPAVGRKLGALDFPGGHTPVSVLHRRTLREADPHLTLQAGDRINLLAHAHSGP